MQIGNKSIELVWPGLFYAIPAILLFLVMPGFLIFSLCKYSSASKLRKIPYIPLCMVGPFVICGVIPFLLSIMGFFRLTDSGVFETYVAFSSIFGEYSNYVWTLFTGVVVYGIHRYLKNHGKK
jgi:hypothetical protein